MHFIKRSLIITPLLLVHLYAAGQIAQGTIRIGPTINFQSTGFEIDGSSLDLRTNSLQLAAVGSYYVMENLEVGLGLAVTSQNSAVDNSDSREIGLFVGPQVAYMVPLQGSLYLPIGAGVGFNRKVLDDEITEITFTGLSFGAGFGLEYIVSNKLGARAMLNGAFGSLNDVDSPAQIDVSDWRFSLGVSFYFN